MGKSVVTSRGGVRIKTRHPRPRQETAANPVSLRQRRSTRVDAEAGRNRFLAAADRVFIREGYDGSTIRAIAKEAGTSLARLNRHWSGKIELFREVFARHFNRIHEAQNARLDVVAATNATCDLRAILEAFLDPALLANVGPRDQRTSHLVYCRALIDPAPEAAQIVAGLIKAVGPRIIAMLQKAVPDRDPETFYLIVATVMGAYIQPQLFGMQLAEAMGISFEAVNWSRAGSVIAELLENGIRGSGNGRPRTKQGFVPSKR
jgi:AcrR family transcriptional regulator